MSRRPHLILPLLVALALLAPATASAWAPAATAPIHPGVQTVTEGSGQCTSNFIFTDGGDTYIGQAAHCSSHRRRDRHRRLRRRVAAARHQGRDRRSRRQGHDGLQLVADDAEHGEADEETCAYNDLALVKIDPADVAKVNPSIPDFGGPTGVGTAAAGQQIYTYGNSSLRPASPCSAPRTAPSSRARPAAGATPVYTVTPGIPGDSGSAFLNASGQALGVLSTVAIAPLPASNGVGDVGHEIAYARSHGFGGLQLVNGTEPFKPKLLGQVPLG